MPADKVECRTPTPGKQGTKIDAWKFDLVRQALLAEVPCSEEGAPFRGLADRLAARISPEDLARLGSIGWYTTTVKLELEVRGEIERVPGPGPQRLRRKR